MIIEALLKIISGIVRGFASMLPTHHVDTAALGETVGQIGAYAGALDGYAPMTQLGLALAFLVTLKLALMAWNVILFIYHQFWGSA